MCLEYQVALGVLVPFSLWAWFELNRQAPQYRCGECGNYHGTPLQACPNCGHKLGEEVSSGDR